MSVGMRTEGLQRGFQTVGRVCVIDVDRNTPGRRCDFLQPPRHFPQMRESLDGGIDFGAAGQRQSKGARRVRSLKIARQRQM